ncbi:phosphonate ABC transporter, permease protein PhnE [Butyrivibrio sp. INlla16]|uniref:phosphonate ABC transporter, permease protein PhnE n=1 Tax=Butyrivibrio sp. INlla16 TaxID=1520807 RepID=UPI000883F110|nr:phosphonate ABC transporter, permease protein PhnE [Butyrivibrio sp. INlla16]SDB58096.1 phosphonate transport system permease protein [Butyrivibrio sp. INlla16]
MSIYDKIFKPKVYTLPNGKTVEKKASRMPVYFILVFLMCAVSVKVTGFDMKILSERIGQFFVILGEMFPPNVSYIEKVWSPLFDTIKMSLLGSALGALLSVPFAMLASTNVCPNKVVVSVIRVMFSLIRTLPTLVTALVATLVFGLGTLAGTFAIAVFSFAYIGKLTYEEIETVDMGAFEAMEAMGATKARAFISAIVPQVLPFYLSNCLFNFEGNVRYAAVLGYVGAGGIGLILNEKISWREYSSVGTVLVALFIAVFIIESISRMLRKKLV